MSEKRLSGKVALVTGSARGINAAVAMRPAVNAVSPGNTDTDLNSETGGVWG